MPVRHRKLRMLRQTGLIAAHRRSDFSDRILATILAAIAGCANAGGFILLGSYTSHMTGYLSQLADQVALQNLALAMKSVLAIGLFVSGAATSAFLINWARRHARARQYTLPIGLQGALFVVLAAVGALNLSTPVSTHLGLGLIAFIAAIVGGFNQIRGALLGGLLVGVIDNMTATYLTAEYRAAVPLVLLILIILFKPEGLLGTPEGRSV